MADYYVQELLLDQPLRWVNSVWCVEEPAMNRVGVPECKNTINSYFEATAGQSVWDTIAKATPWLSDTSRSRFTKSNMVPGIFYNRMARPISDHPNDISVAYPATPADNEMIAVSMSQLLTLATQLQSICQTVHPHIDTFNTFGHNIRNFLILACTEVEAQWTGILRANNYPSRKMTTNDYVKLSDPMRLNEFEVRFPLFPWINPIKPFENWDKTGKPTTDIQWYASYNAVKHNREQEFKRATLLHAFEAMAACYVMLVAQFGFSFKGPYHHSDLTFFDLSARPSWPTCDLYLRPNEHPLSGPPDSGWKPVDFSF